MYLITRTYISTINHGLTVTNQNLLVYSMIYIQNRNSAILLALRTHLLFLGIPNRSVISLCMPNPTKQGSAFPILAALRLAILLCLQSDFGRVVAVFATVCSTWTRVNIGTSKRSILVSRGDISLLGNRRGNKMTCRTGVGKTCVKFN